MEQSLLAQAMSSAGFSAAPDVDGASAFDTNPSENNARTWAFGQRSGAIISRNSSSEYLNEFFKHGQQIIDAETASTTGIKCVLIPITREKHPNLKFSCVVLALQMDKPAGMVAYHPMLLEGTGEKLQDITREAGNTVFVEAIRCTANAYDHTLSNLVIEAVRQTYPNIAPDRIFGTSVTVVRDTFDVKSPEKVRAAIMNGGLAVHNKLKLLAPDLVPLNLTYLDPKARLSSRVHFFHSNTTADTLGDPVRSDQVVIIKQLLNSGRRRDANDVNTPDDEPMVAEVCCFVNPLFDEPETNGDFWAQQNAQRSQCWVPELVITNIAVAEEYHPGTIWLALLTAASSFAARNNWLKAFKPNKSIRGKFDPRDPGYLNLNSNVLNDPQGGAYEDLKADDFTDNLLLNYLSKCFQNKLVVSMDAVIGGPNSWFTNIFEAAARGDTAAKDVLWLHLNILLGERLAEHFPRGGDIFVAKTPMVYGTWTDSDGNLRSLTDFDPLRVEAKCAADRTAVFEYMNTFYSTEHVSDAENLAKRKGFLNHLTDGTANFTNVGYRLTFNPKLFEAAFKILREEPFANKFVLDTDENTLNFQQQRYSARFAQGAALGSNVSFLRVGSPSSPVETNGLVGGFRARAW